MKNRHKLFFSFFMILLCNFIVFADLKELKIKGDQAFYKETQKIFITIGNSYMEIDNNIIYCDEMEVYLTKDDNVKVAIFRRNIRIFKEEDQVQIGGEYAEYYKEKKMFIIRENAFYIDEKDEVAVFGDSIYNYEKEELAIIQGNTRVLQKDIFATGAFVKYTKQDKLMEISGFPKVKNQGSEYRAKKIIVDVDKNTFNMEGGIEAEIYGDEEEDSE
ncbi:MAG: hypothetical protein MJB14_10480 [Spirochaetes bacterium]|nr:hypothetical protein [Spirochaetota bacterium]